MNFNESELDEFAFASRKVPEYMHFRMVRCPECGVLYVTPAPDPRWFDTGYEGAAFDARDESRYAARTYAKVLPSIARRLPELDGALDIGAGDGAFLQRLLDAGFSNVVGLEPSRAPIDQATPEIAALLRNEFFTPDSFSPDSFSLISCFQTLEHLRDPLSLFHSAYTMLKRGGAMYTVAHNQRAFSAVLLGRRSPIYDIEHLQLFSPDSLRRLYGAVGFRETRVRPIANTYPLVYWLRLLPMPRSLKSKVLAWARGSAVGRIPITLPAGNIMAVGFK